VRAGVGPIPLGSMSREQLQEIANAAVAASFDAVWVAEDRARGVGAGLAAAALVAQLVPIRVGAVVDVGLFHPLHLAEDIAVADIASGGRLEVILRPAADRGTEAEIEDVDVIKLALSGAHMRWEGEELVIPAGLTDNQPVPSRLALNPMPLQPVMPLWLLDIVRAGFGLAKRWEPGLKLGADAIPDLVLCSGDVNVADLLNAASGHAGYFLVTAGSAQEVMAAGRRMVGPLRMPEFPDWVNA